MIELGFATLCAWALISHLIASEASPTLLAQMITVADSETALWCILWVGVVNTGLGIVWVNRITNKIGLPTMTSVSQARPLVSEMMLWGVGGSTLATERMIDLASSFIMLLTAGKLVARPKH